MNEVLKKRLFDRLVNLLSESIRRGLWGKARDIAEEAQSLGLGSESFESLKDKLFQYYREES